MLKIYLPIFGDILKHSGIICSFKNATFITRVIYNLLNVLFHHHYISIYTLYEEEKF